MPFFALHWSASSAAFKVMTEKPQNREAAARQLIEGFGGKLHHYFFMFGEYDGLAIVEFPDIESAAASSMRARSTNAFTRFETQALMTAQEAERSMQKVKSLDVPYKAPDA